LATTFIASGLACLAPALLPLWVIGGVRDLIKCLSEDGCPVGEVVPTYSVSFRLQRTTTEFAFVSVPVTGDLMIDQPGNENGDAEHCHSRSVQANAVVGEEKKGDAKLFGTWENLRNGPRPVRVPFSILSHLEDQNHGSIPETE
jgi:hypothetical protein